jgi:hypothetical protein
VAGLPAWFAPALLPRRATPALCARQAIGGRRLGRVGRILFARRQLPFQIGDLLFGVGDLPIPFRYLLTKFLNLTLLLLDLPAQFFLVGRMPVRMTTRL